VVSHAWNLIRQYNLNNGINRVFIDGSQPGFIRSLKIAIGEYAQYEYFVEKAKQDNNRPLHLYMNIVPVMRIATADEEMSLDKTEYSMDLLDSLRLAFEYIIY
jgi:hypothetical protein